MILCKEKLRSGETGGRGCWGAGLFGWIFMIALIVQLYRLNDRLHISGQENCLFNILSREVRKPVFMVSDQVPHKLACTVTEEG